MADNLPNINPGTDPSILIVATDLAPALHNIRPQDTVESFTTSRGSIYTYDEEGHTTRFKTATGQEQPRQDLTVFIEFGPRDIGALAAAYLLRGSTEATKIDVVEIQPDGRPKVVNDTAEVILPDSLRLVVFKDGEIARSRPASLFPKTGLYVFDSRRFEEGGVTRTERHLGHKVTGIKPRLAD